MRHPDVTLLWPSKEMDNVAFLTRIPPLKKLNLHTGCNQRQARLFDLYLKTAMGQDKCLRMIE